MLLALRALEARAYVAWVQVELPQPVTTQALTGQAVTASAGTLVPELGAISGQSATSAAGSLAPDQSQGLTGQSVAFAYGSLAAGATDPRAYVSWVQVELPDVDPNVTQALSGLSASAFAGDIATEGGTTAVEQVGHAKRVIYQVEIDGETIYFDTVEGAEAALRNAQKRAKSAVRAIKRRAKHVPLLEQEIRPPAVVSDHDFADKYIVQIHAMFAELEAMRAAELEQDDEDVLLLL